MPKHTDDPTGRARAVAEDLIRVNDDDPATIVKAFPIVKMETETFKSKGESLPQQRVVLVGPWQPVAE